MTVGVTHVRHPGNFYCQDATKHGMSTNVHGRSSDSFGEHLIPNMMTRSIYLRNDLPLMATHDAFESHARIWDRTQDHGITALIRLALNSRFLIDLFTQLIIMYLAMKEECIVILPSPPTGQETVSSLSKQLSDHYGNRCHDDTVSFQPGELCAAYSTGKLQWCLFIMSWIQFVSTRCEMFQVSV